MEGLLLAEVLRELARRLPAETVRWSFPDDRTTVARLAGGDGLWLFTRPPHPRAAVLPSMGPIEAPRTPFQAMLAARAVGPLLSARQQRLDRVLELSFGASEGFAPQPPVTLVAELTGRNANLVLLDAARSILGVERVVLHDRNRYRELRPRVPYLPPPPYQKLDPTSASTEELRAVLEGKSVRELRAAIDGVGPRLARAIARRSGTRPDDTLTGATLDAVLGALREAVAAPAEALERFEDAAAADGALSALREQRRERALRPLLAAARARLELAAKRRHDAEQALAREAEAERLRAEADLLNAYAEQVPAGATTVTLAGFDGEPMEIALDPSLAPRVNASKRYERARKREARAARARDQASALAADLADAERELALLPTLDVDELERRLPRDTRRPERPRAVPGIRFRDAHGFEVVVGRNARENEHVTFKVARSLDLWLHVQGTPGAHVVVRSGGKQVPFETVLFAAGLAAGFSPARHETSVAVDYTERKHVWKVKGQPAGTVNYARQKTVYVEPVRSPGGGETQDAERNP